MAALALVSIAKAYAADSLVADTFTATTANMTPAGASLRVQIIAWQDLAARREAVASLAAGADAATPLAKLPTVGYVWPADGPVGYAVKYAHRESLPDGGERITLVTSPRLGSYEFKGWSAPNALAGDAAYSVVELDLNGAGIGNGTFSLAAEVAMDEQAGAVGLDGGATAPRLLTNVARAPAPR